VRKKVPKKVVIDNGSRVSLCSCRNIFAIDIHHIIEVVEGGGNELANLIALCPVMHFFHRGIISHSWKSMLVSLSRAFDIRV